MADAAEGNINLHVVRAGCAAGNPQRFKGFVPRVSAISIYLHDVFLSLAPLMAYDWSIAVNYKTIPKPDDPHSPMRAP
jgi:hypothetical protein